MQGWVAAVTGKDNCVRALQAPETLNFYDLGAGHLLAAFLEALLCYPGHDISRDQSLQHFLTAEASRVTLSLEVNPHERTFRSSRIEGK